MREPAKYFGICILAFSFLVGARKYYFVILAGGDGYSTGEWLINYESGFVRRGMFGSIFLWLTPDSPNIIWILYFFQIALVGSIFLYFALELFHRQSNWLLTILLCSPAGIASYGWNEKAFGRKEFLGFLILILLTYGVKTKGRSRYSRILLPSSLLVFVLGVFSWEPTALFLPSIICLLNIGYLSAFKVRTKIMTYSLFIIVGISGILTPLIFSGTTQNSSTICQAVRNNGLSGENLCIGSIYAISGSIGDAFAQLQNSFPMYFIYLPLIIIAFGPFLYARVFSLNSLNYGLIIISFVPLFLITTDWGRWVAMIVISLLVVMLATGDIDRIKRRVTSVIGIIYVLGWGLPYWASANEKFPVVGALPTIVKLLRHIV